MHNFRSSTLCTRSSRMLVAGIRRLIAQANAQEYVVMGHESQRGRILGEGAGRGGVQGCLVSISSACLRVVSVISLPPDMRAISSMRSAKLSGWMSVVV